jgi:cyanophycin synthetase
MDSTNLPLRTLRALRGPNRYAPVPVLYAELETAALPAWPAISEYTAVARLQTWLPDLAVLPAPPHASADGIMLAQLWVAVACALQRRVGFQVTVSAVLPTAEPGVVALIIDYEEEVPARMAVDTAGRLTLAALHDTLAGVEDAIEALWDVADDYRFGPSTAAIVAAARRRGIPVTRLTPRDGLVQLGYGVHQRRIQAAQSAATSAIAVAMCQDKGLTTRMLRTVGVPVPDSQPVRAASEAWAVAQDVGLPVVVKPEDGNQGKGVSVGLTTAAEVEAAYALARS